MYFCFLPFKPPSLQLSGFMFYVLFSKDLALWLLLLHKLVRASWVICILKNLTCKKKKINVKLLAQNECSVSDNGSGKKDDDTDHGEVFRVKWGFWGKNYYSPLPHFQNIWRMSGISVSLKKKSLWWTHSLW